MIQDVMNVIDSSSRTKTIATTTLKNYFRRSLANAAASLVLTVRYRKNTNLEKIGEANLSHFLQFSLFS